MSKLAALFLVALALSGCDLDRADTTLASYETAKADCAPHGGLKIAKTSVVYWSPNRVDAFCVNGVRVSRNVPRATP